MTSRTLPIAVELVRLRGPHPEVLYGVKLGGMRLGTVKLDSQLPNGWDWWVPAMTHHLDDATLTTIGALVDEMVKEVTSATT